MMTFVLQAQTVPVLPTIESVTQHLLAIRQQQAAQLREEVSCTRETELNWNSASMKWDSAYQTISKVEEVDGKTNIIIESYEYDEVEGHVLTEEIHAYGIEGFINLEDEPAFYDSLLLFGPDQFTGDLILVARILPTYGSNGKIAKQETYFNTAFFGFPLGFVLFGVNLYYYDMDDYLIAESSKEVDLGTFDLMNGDTTAYTNNSAGQILVEQTWTWNADLMIYEPISRTTNTWVSPGGDMATLTYESYDEGTMSWVYNSRTVYSYSKPGLVSKAEIQVGMPGSWQTVQEINYTYDGMDRQTLALYKSVEANGNKTDTYREVTKWDTVEGWISETISQDNVNGTWVNSDRTILEPCSPVSSITPALVQDAFLNTWFDASQQLQLTFADHTVPQSLVVYDLQGRLNLSTTLRNGQRQIDGSSLMPGMYLVRVTFADGSVAARQAQKF